MSLAPGTPIRVSDALTVVPSPFGPLHLYWHGAAGRNRSLSLMLSQGERLSLAELRAYIAADLRTTADELPDELDALLSAWQERVSLVADLLRRGVSRVVVIRDVFNPDSGFSQQLAQGVPLTWATRWYLADKGFLDADHPTATAGR